MYNGVCIIYRNREIEEKKMVKVVKFGGSSLASAEQFVKVGDIIRADETRRYVVFVLCLS